jgi:hypothetical protein
MKLISQPLPLLYNDGAVLLGLVYGFLPFMVLPLYATLERLDPVLLEAAADLGARPWTVFYRVIVPLAGPGIWAGSVLVFIPCLGAYLTPDLLGGGKTVMIGNWCRTCPPARLAFGAAAARADGAGGRLLAVFMRSRTGNFVKRALGFTLQRRSPLCMCRPHAHGFQRQCLALHAVGRIFLSGTGAGATRC